MRSVLVVHWKDWCWSWNSNTLSTSCKELTHWKRLWCREGLGAGGEGDDRGWDGWMHHWLNGREFDWTLGVGDGQGGLVCCDSWGCKESDTTERLNWTELNWCVEVTQLCLTLCYPWTIARQAPLSMKFSKQEYWNGLPFPSPGDLPDSEIESRSPTLQADS